MMSAMLLLISLLPWSPVSPHSLLARRGDGDEDTALDREFHKLIGIPHRSEEHDEVLTDIEIRKLVNEGVIKHGDIRDSHNLAHDEEEAELDAEFHKVLGVPHRSEEEDDELTDMELKKLVGKGKIKQADLDLMVAMDNFDELMNTAEILSRKERSTSMTDDELYAIMAKVVTSVSKAGEKVMKNKAFAGKLLENSKFLLQNVDKAFKKEGDSRLLDENLKNAMKSEKILDKFLGNMAEVKIVNKNKRSVPEMDPKISLKDMLKDFYMEKNVVKIPSAPLRTARSVDPEDSLNHMLNGYYLEHNALKIPSAPLREARSVGPVDEEFSSALDAATVLDEVLAGLDDKVSRERRRAQHPSNLVARGYSEDQYRWLRVEFDLTREEVDSVKVLTAEQFSALQSSLKNSRAEGGKEYTTEDLVGVLKTARQLVPSELEAAAHGALHMGYHLGERAKVAADPMVRLVNNKVMPGAKKMWRDAVESMPDDVKDWAGDGQRIAAKRVQAVAEYAGPRLARMGKSMAKLQVQLSKSAEGTLRELVPRIVPALQMLVGELQDTLELAREVIPPMVQTVGEQAAPFYDEFKDTMSVNVVNPFYDYLTSEAIARPVGEAIDTVSPFGNAAYQNLAMGSQAVYDEVSPVLGDLATSSGQVLREQVMPAVEEMGENARHQAGRVGHTVKTSVRDVLKSTLDTVFDGVPKILQQVSHEVHDAAKVFRGRYSSALGKMRSREEQEDSVAGGPASVSPPVFRPSKAPKRTYVTSTEL